MDRSTAQTARGLTRSDKWFGSDKNLSSLFFFRHISYSSDILYTVPGSNSPLILDLYCILFLYSETITAAAKVYIQIGTSSHALLHHNL